MCVEAYKVRLASARSKVKFHEEILLPWIEQQRITMVAAQSPTVDIIDGPGGRIDNIRRAPFSEQIRKGSRKEQSVLGPIRSAVSKTSTLEKRNPRRQKVQDTH